LPLRRTRSLARPEDVAMRDLFYLLGTVAFFGLMVRYAQALRRLGDRNGMGQGR
jgi:hypothetical protein